MIDKFYALYFRTKGGKVLARRRFHENPLVINIQKDYAATRLGKMSGAISDKCHQMSNSFSEKLANKMTLYHWKRRWLFPATILLGFAYGYIMVCHMQAGNMYERGYRNKTL